MAKDAKGYTLVPTALPVAQRSGIYTSIIEEFIASILTNADVPADTKNAPINIPGKATKPLSIGLTKAVQDLKKDGNADAARVSVRTINGDVWLTERKPK